MEGARMEEARIPGSGTGAGACGDAPSGVGAAEAARRALRAARARERGSGAGGEDDEGPGSGPVPVVRTPRRPTAGPRPGDAARAALRDAVSARRARDAGGDGAAAGEEAPAGAPAAFREAAPARVPAPLREAPPAGAPAPLPAGRPGDAARAALRSALAEERSRAGTDAGPARDRSRPGADAGSTEERSRPGEGPAPAEQHRRPREETRPAPGTTRQPGPASDTGTAAHPGADTPVPSPHPAVSRLLAALGQPPAPEPPERRPAQASPPRATADTPHPTRNPTPHPTADTPHPTASTPNPTRNPAPNPTPPPSMASPRRDGDHRRTFPALAPGAGDGFAGTWWGGAWIAALEEGALDAKRLARGRGYAEQGHVDAITVTPGLVLAYVQGSRARPYRVQVRLLTLGDDDWERFLDAAAERPGHIAALLDKEMPHALAEGEVRLLPGPGDLDPQCSCPDRAHPCKHAAALCYQTARLLDADPFVLLLLRGRGERELLDALSRRSAARAARAAQERAPAALSGVRATAALAPRRLPPLPPPLPVPPHPEQPPAYPASPGGPDPFALDQLATDAAARAHALLATGRDPVAGLTLWQDAVRLAAARPGSGLTAGTRALYASLAAATGRTSAELARAVAAWRQGGFEGLAVLEEPWDPPAGRFDRARPLLRAADLPAFRPWRNRLTHPHGRVQLRLGRDGLWYAYESDESEPGADDWWPRGTPDLDPVGALTGLGTEE
ncbi:SWIM zinc finger family protein [Streptomyces sp. NPDC093252]|uniref:SWIM zinc finger family protein n=1 Tax=Streptomyces sp. NPDC093252 TaxID=3154980 RepID=UPI003415BC72